MHLASLVADRDIFTRSKCMRAKTVAAFIVGIRSLVVVEHPAPMFGAARPMNQKAVLIGFASPESPDAADVAMLLPQHDVDMTLAVERRDKFITMSRRSLRELLGAGEIEPDAFENVRQGGHSLVSLIVIMLLRMPQYGKGMLARAYWYDGRRFAAAGDRLPERSRQSWRNTGQAHRHPCCFGVSGRRAGIQDQPGGTVSISRFFHAQETQGGL